MVANEVLVRFLPGAAGPARSRALARVRGTVAERIVTVAMHQAGDQEGVTLVRTPLPPLQAVAAIAVDSTVEYAEPNWIYQADAVADDPYLTDGSLWGMTGQYGSGASAAWAQDRVGSASVAIGIIDEGYMYTHEDLAANAGTNPGEIAGNRVDDDGNGLVDDVWGWDFDGGNSSVFDGVADDHGTHVAGTIGAAGGNGVGVAGMVWQVRLLGAKFLGTRGGTTANAIKAVDDFTALKTRGSNPVNIVATNNSWGGGGYSQALRDAITRAGAANILFVAAAGNSAVNCDLFPCYPAAYTNANVVAVAALTSSGARASFSNYGGTTVDLGAPGSGIWSTVPLKAKRGTASGYAAYSGTSMAGPPRDGCRGALCRAPPRRHGGAGQGGYPGRHRAHRVAGGCHRHRRPTERLGILTRGAATGRLPVHPAISAAPPEPGGAPCFHSCPPPGPPHGQDQGGEPRRRDGRRRDDAHHLAVHQGQADPALPRPPARLLRPGDPAPRRHQ
jgi:hypothetical protein